MRLKRTGPADKDIVMTCVRGAMALGHQDPLGDVGVVLRVPGHRRDVACDTPYTCRNDASSIMARRGYV